MSDVYAVQFYSLKPLPEEVKYELELPYDPYSDNPEERAEVDYFLQQQGIFVYRDSDHQHCRLYDIPVGDESVLQATGYTAYASVCLLEEDDLTIAYKEDEISGEPKPAWMKWNEEVRIVHVNTEAIKIMA